MNKLIIIGLLLLSSALVSAQWMEGPSGTKLYAPRVEGNAVPKPASALQDWHAAKRMGESTFSIREWGRSYEPVGLRLVQPLNVQRRWDRTGYISVYGIERQAIIPWTRPLRVSNLNMRVV